MDRLGYRPATCEYTVTEADNGFIFSSYSISTDEMTYRVAKTPQELGDIIREWQEQRISQMIQYQSQKS